MGEYQIIHFPAREDPITGGKLQPYTSFEGRQRIWPPSSVSISPAVLVAAVIVRMKILPVANQPYSAATWLW